MTTLKSWWCKMVELPDHDAPITEQLRQSARRFVLWLAWCVLCGLLIYGTVWLMWM